MVPFASLALAYTNTVGAALWAADIEKRMSAAGKEDGKAEWNKLAWLFVRLM